MNKVFIIAEAGVNHNGSLKIAKKMIDIAANAGADAVKFQTFKAGRVVTRDAQKAAYQKNTSIKKESQFEMLRRLELDLDAHKQLIVHCKKRGIIFLSTPFDEESIELLVKLGVNIFKIPSGEITNLPYLRHVGSLRKKVILSTGMADMKEVRKAVKVLMKAGTPKRDIIILHCTTEYPTPYKDVNLRAMVTMGKELKMAIGYSDHTLGIEVPVAAVALGSTVVEKHFTLGRNMKGPDHRSSLEPDELKRMVMSVRNIEKSLGDGVKRPSLSELRNKIVVRKSIVAAQDIKKGEIFCEQNIATKRPDCGICPMKWNTVIGRRAKKYFKRDEFIHL